MRRFNSNTGFTLVEILVVIAIIGILISLSIQALRPAVVTAQRAQCQNNLREIAHATLSYELKNRHLPGYLQKFGEFSGGSDPSDPDNHGGNVPRHFKLGSWVVALLAELQQQPIYDHWTLDQYPILSSGSGYRASTIEGYSAVAAANLTVLQCPSASGSRAEYGKNNYVANTGLHFPEYPASYTRPNGTTHLVSFTRAISKVNAAFTNSYAGYDQSNPTQLVLVGKPISTDQFTDGLANTLLFTESNQAASWYLTRLSRDSDHLTTIVNLGGQDVSVYPDESRYLQGVVWHFEDPVSFAGAAPVKPVHQINGGDPYNDTMTIANCADLARPSSLHFDGVNVVMADGHVIFLPDTTDYRVLQAMMTPVSKRSDMPQNGFVQTDSL